MKKDNIFNIRWIETFRDIKDILEQIRLKWVFDQKDLFITYKDGILEYKIRQGKLEILSLEEIEAEKMAIKKRLIHGPVKVSKEMDALIKLGKQYTLPGIELEISEEDWQIYNECVFLYSEKYAEYLLALNNHNQKAQECISLDFELHNKSNQTFYDLIIYIYFPDDLEIVEDPYDNPPKAPDTPPKPRVLQMSLFETKNFREKLIEYKEKLKFKRYNKTENVLSRLVSPDFSHLINTPFKILDDNGLQVSLDRLTQSHCFDIDGYTFHFKQSEIERKLKINWKIFTGKPSRTIEGELTIII